MAKSPGGSAVYEHGLRVNVSMSHAEDAPRGTFIVYLTIGIGSSRGRTVEPLDGKIEYSLDHGSYQQLAPDKTGQWSVKAADGGQAVKPTEGKMDDSAHLSSLPSDPARWVGDQSVDTHWASPAGQWTAMPLDIASFTITGASPEPGTIDLKLPLKSDGDPMVIEIEFKRLSNSFSSPVNGC
ncbi:MAG TPA: hypothetical protein VGM16_06530 [Gammaproteobacteria bacterium]|jgi:hypothetical protein